MASKDEKQALPKAPKGEGVDPLTDGNRYYGEDIKGNSVHDTDTAEVKKTNAKTAKLDKDQAVAKASAKKAAEKKAK
jgi:hypothetical protein